MSHPPPATDSWKPQRGQKDTKAWCRGKVGRAHQTDLRVCSWAQYAADRWQQEPRCKWTCFYRWVRGESVQDDRTWHWMCLHERYCTVCGKILEHSLSRECPDWTSRRAAL